MPLSSYEVVRRAIEFDQPDRLPVRFDSLGPSDIHTFDWNPYWPWNVIGAKSTLDEWGCRWRQTELKNMGQPKKHPLAERKNLNSFRGPDPDPTDFYRVCDAGGFIASDYG